MYKLRITTTFVHFLVYVVVVQTQIALFLAQLLCSLFGWRKACHAICIAAGRSLIWSDVGERGANIVPACRESTRTEAKIRVIWVFFRVI